MVYHQRQMPPTPKPKRKKNKAGRPLGDLAKIESAVALEKERKAKKRKQYPEGGRTRIAAGVRRRTRRPPAVPEGKSLAEIKEMDPDDPQFRRPEGRKRKTGTRPKEQLDWRASAKEDKQKRSTERKAKVRKWEAEVITARKELPATNSPGVGVDETGVAEEDLMIANGTLDLTEWDDEELARGYRRGRNGKFSRPPAVIPREVQQEAFRRIVKSGDRQLKSAHIEAIKQLTWLAGNAESEKVRLEAVKEIMQRNIGKVPERIHVGQDQPWEDFLADSLEPVNEMPALIVEAEVHKRGGEVDAPDTPQDAAPADSEPVAGEAPSPPSPGSSEQEAGE